MKLKLQLQDKLDNAKNIGKHCLMTTVYWLLWPASVPPRPQWSWGWQCTRDNEHQTDAAAVSVMPPTASSHVTTEKRDHHPLNSIKQTYPIYAPSPILHASPPDGPGNLVPALSGRTTYLLPTIWERLDRNLRTNRVSVRTLILFIPSYSSDATCDVTPQAYRMDVSDWKHISVMQQLKPEFDDTSLG